MISLISDSAGLPRPPPGIKYPTYTKTPVDFASVGVAIGDEYSLNGATIAIIGFADRHTAIAQGALGTIRIPIESFY